MLHDNYILVKLDKNFEVYLIHKKFKLCISKNILGHVFINSDIFSQAEYSLKRIQVRRATLSTGKLINYIMEHYSKSYVWLLVTEFEKG